MADEIDLTFDAQLRGHCQQNLPAFDRLGIDDQTLRPAAVAVVVVTHPVTGDACFLLTPSTSGLVHPRG